MADRSLKFVLGLETKKFKGAIGYVKKELKSLGNVFKSAFAVGGFTMLGKSIINAGKDFQDAMAQVQAVSNATTAEMEKMTAAARQFGRTSIFSSKQAADSLINLTRNGLTATQAVEALGPVLKLAQANAIELNQAADILTNTLNMFGLSVSESERVIDVLSTTAAHTATNILQLYQALVNAAPAAKVLNFSVEEVSAALGALAQRGVKAELAGTQLRMALVKMADPKIVAKMQAMGIAISEEQMRSEGLLATIEKLRDAHVSFSDLVGIFSQKGAVGIQQMINVYDDFAKVLEYTTNAAGTANRMFEQGVGSVRKEIDILKNSWNELMIGILDGTQGAIKGVVKYLQNLVNNFRSLGGTLLNIGTIIGVAFPNAIIKTVGAFGKLWASVKSGTSLMKALFSANFVSIIIRIASLVGSVLVSSWIKYTEALRESRREMKKAGDALAEMQGKASAMTSKFDNIISKLGPNTDKKTLAGVVKQLTEMFPDFSQAINDAAKKLDADGNWEAFKSLLDDIRNTQLAIMGADANKAYAEAAGQRAAQLIGRPGRRQTLTTDRAGNYVTERTFTGKLADAFRDAFGKQGKQVEADFYKYLGKVITQNIGEYGEDWVKTGRDVNKYLKGLGIDKFGDRELGTELHDALYKTSEGSKVMTTLETQTRLAKENGNKIAEIGAKLNDTTIPDETAPVSHPAEKEEKLEGDIKDVKKIVEDYEEGVEGLNNRLHEGTITQEDYNKELDELEDKTYEALTAIKEFRELLEQLGHSTIARDLKEEYEGNRSAENAKKTKEQSDKLREYKLPEVKGRDSSSDFMKSKSDILKEEVEIELKYKDEIKKVVDELAEAINSGNFDLVKEDAIRRLQYFRDLMQDASDNAGTFQQKLNDEVMIDKLNEEIEKLGKSHLDSIKDVAQAFDRLYESISDVAEAFGNDINEDIAEGWKQVFAVINAGVQTLETMRSVMEALQIVSDLTAKKKLKNSVLEVGAALAVAEAEKKKASASAKAGLMGAISSLSSIPGLGPALAVAAVGGLMALIAKIGNSFANGGIVGGNSYSGDKQIIRANSGELLLTRSQQGTLFNAIKSGNLGGGNVQFRIRGEDLIGTIQNYNTIHK